MELQKLPVYKLYLTKMTLDALTLPPERQQEAAQRHDEFMAQVGAKVILVADCVWSNEEFGSFGVEEYPNFDALLEFHDCLKSLNWFGYFQSKSYLGWLFNGQDLGAPFIPPPPPEPGTRPIYKVAMFKEKAPHTEEYNAAYAKAEEAAQKAGVVSILSAYSRLANEEWWGFELERYPSLDAFYDHYVAFETSGYFNYTEAKTVLGIATGGTISGLDQ